MARYIDADKLIEALQKKEAEPSYYHTGEDWYTGLILAEEIVWKQPTADVRENKHGEWIKDTKRFGEDNYHCSVCSAVLEEDDVKWRNNYFCYHCGARCVR